MAALAKQRIIKAPRGPFAYPGTRPGFVPSHVAAQNPRFSGADGINLLNGVAGTVNGTVSKSVKLIGPCATSSSGSSYLSFAGNTAADTVFTCAAIVDLRSANNTWLFNTSSPSTATNGISFGIAAGGVIFHERGNFQLIGNGLVNGGIYFLAGSIGASRMNAVGVDILTGKVVVNATTGAGLSPLSPSGTYAAFGGGGANHLSGSFVGPVMFSATFLSLPQLLQWAADPWSFWYPVR